MSAAVIQPGSILGMARAYFDFLERNALPKARRTNGGDLILEYGRVARAIPFAIGAIWLVLMTLITVSDLRNGARIKASEVVPVVLIAAASVFGTYVPYWRSWARVSSQTLTTHSFWSGARSMQWSEIEAVLWQPLDRSWRLKGKRGKIEVSGVFDGHADFVDSMRQYLRPEVAAKIPQSATKRAASAAAPSKTSRTI